MIDARAAAARIALPYEAQVRRLSDGRLVRADTVEMTESLRATIADAWRPLLKQHGAEDAGWDWRDKHLDPAHENEVQQVALLVDAMPQGVLMTSLALFIPPVGSVPAPVLYVEYIAAAPWNRPSESVRRYGGVGTVLMSAGA